MTMQPLTDSDRMDRYLSDYGVAAFARHDDGAVQDAIDYATLSVVGALAQRYNVAALVNSAVILEITTVIALRVLCMRRGNPIPESLEMRYQEIVSKDGFLAQLAEGNPKLVDGNGIPIAGKGGYCPSFSNLTVDRRYNQQQIRVKPGASSNQPTQLERDTTIGGSQWSM